MALVIFLAFLVFADLVIGFLGGITDNYPTNSVNHADILALITNNYCHLLKLTIHYIMLNKALTV